MSNSSGAAKADQTPEQAVITQVEFYLSDSNLPFDKFLFSLWASAHRYPEKAVALVDKDAKGWVPLAKIASFSRMKPFLAQPPAGLGGIDGIAKALEKSEQIDVKEFKAENEPTSGWYIKRKFELKRPEDTMARSAYVKGFPTVEKDPETQEEREAAKQKEDELQKQLEAWARSLDIGQVKSVRMRREPASDKPEERASATKARGKFKGSVFVEFASRESVDKLLALDPKPEFEGKPLEVKSKTDYVEEKRKIYAPDSAPGSMSTPKGPSNNRGNKPFNAWAEDLISQDGAPRSVPRVGGRDDRKRKADTQDDEDDTRDIMFDGVKFTARRKDGKVTIDDVDNVATGEGQWPAGRALYFTLGKKDGSFGGEKEAGEPVAYKDFKDKIAEIAPPSFVQLIQERKVAELPKSASSASSEFPDKPDAPPAVKSANDGSKPETESGPADDSKHTYPCRGQISFKQVVDDDAFAKLTNNLKDWQGRALKWERMSAEDERRFMLSRAQFHSEQAFVRMAGGRGGDNRRGGGGRGRGGHRGGGNKRTRRD